MFTRRATEAQPWQQAEDPALAFTMVQLAQYRRAMNRSRRIHRTGELLILLCTGATVLVSALSAPAPVTASIAAATLFLTGYRQVFNPNERWVNCGIAWMSLQQEVARYHLLSAEERDPAAQRALLDRTNEIVSVENRAWAEGRRAATTTRSEFPAPR